MTVLALPSFVRRIAMACAIALFALLIFGQPEESGAVEVILVVDDSGDPPSDGVCGPPDCTLREALERANVEVGLSNIPIITFDPVVFPMGAPVSILPTAPLPDVIAPFGVEIDGTGAGVIIDGSLAGAARGVVITSGVGVTVQNTVVRGLTVRDFTQTGVFICGGGPPGCTGSVENALVENVNALANGGNGIYLDGDTVEDSTVTGGSAIGNGSNGIEFNGPSGITNNSVIDVLAWSNDSDGVELNAIGLNTGSTVEDVSAALNGNNGVQINAAGHVEEAVIRDSLGNSNDNSGLRINGSQTISSSVVERGTANNNGDYGVQINASDSVSGSSIIDSEASGNPVAGLAIRSFVGIVTAPQILGSSATNNPDKGILIVSDLGTTGPVVSLNTSTGNGGIGIDIDSDGANTNVDVSGNSVFDNTEAGIRIFSAPGFGASGTITDNDSDGNEHGLEIETGFLTPGLLVIENTFTGNARDGVAVVTGGSHTISRNVTFDNSGIGIDLFAPGDLAPGVTANDGGDGDLGPNNLLNFPVITAADSEQAMGTACPLCLVEMFRSSEDPSGHGEGAAFLRSATADGAGNFTSAICGFGLSAGEQITSTATDGDGNTSEFSANFTLPEDVPSCQIVLPTPTATPTASPTPTPSVPATPTATGAGDHVWGDATCNQEAGTEDATELLKNEAQLETDTGGCPDIGEAVTVDGIPRLWMDTNCDGAVDAVDILNVLLFLAGLPILGSPPVDCPEIGETVTVT